MLELFSSGLLSLWLTGVGMPDPAQTLDLLVGNSTPWVVTSGTPDRETEAVLQQYLQRLQQTGLTPTTQGVWLQAGSTFLASNQGMKPLPAASLTKVATSLVALHQWAPTHQFETLIRMTGLVQDGVLQGDLIIQGGGDPVMVWEEAITIGNDLNRQGIRRVAGNLLITGDFLMNFETNRQKAGELFKQAINAKNWSGDATYQYQQLPQGTPRPQVEITGTVQVVPAAVGPLTATTPLLRHRSLPLTQILKLMNLYSNNVIAESLANSLGGAAMVAQQAAAFAGVPPGEIVLKNGSGLGVANQISPRAACALFAAIQRHMQPLNLTIADLFPVAGSDQGTIDWRKIPTAAVVKTGTLKDVSALAGVLPTRDRGLVWFAIINRGSDLDGLRAQQDQLLQTLVKHWGKAPSRPVAIAPTATAQVVANTLGDTHRNAAVRSAVEVNAYQQ